MSKAKATITTPDKSACAADCFLVDGEYDPVAIDFDTTETEPLIAAVNKACSPESAARNGELFAISILGKSKGQLLAIMRDLSDEQGESLVDSVCCALRCLEDRAGLVTTAFARLSVCADILGAEQDEAGNREGQTNA